MLNQKIKKQVEFYFSDANYSKDKFLIETSIKNGGAVPISILLSFKRLAALNITVKDVIESIKDSEIVSVENESIKKIETDKYKEYKKNKDISERVLFVEGFNKESSLEEIEEIISKYGKAVKITMRRDSKKNFTGACLVEFESKEEAEKIIRNNDINKVNDDVNKVNDDVKDDIKNDVKEDVKDDIKNDNIHKLSFYRKSEFLDKKNSKISKQEALANKIKADFIPKLYKIDFEGDASIDFIKKAIKNIAFVDLRRNVVRMKYREEFEESEFEFEEKKFKLKRLSEKEALEYVSNINIKSIDEKKNIKDSKDEDNLQVNKVKQDNLQDNDLKVKKSKNQSSDEKKKKFKK